MDSSCIFQKSLIPGLKLYSGYLLTDSIVRIIDADNELNNAKIREIID